ncbi:MAG: NUDIX hydrolase [Parachlamydiaceae bacterium]|nr:NUDIX hydrolase [Parachlamydiaceae bacterium]
MKKSAIAIIFNDTKTELLLIKRRDVPVWVLPGGGIEDNEDPSDGAEREALEETGLTVKIERQVADYQPLNRLAAQTYTFECSVLGGNLAKGAETRNIQFFPLNQLPSSFFFVHQEWVNDALRNESFLISRKLDYVTYSRLILYFMKHPVHVIRALFARLGLPLNSKN